MDRKSLRTPAEMRAEVEGADSDQQAEQLPPTTTFNIDETVRGRRFQGTFGFKVPTLADQIVIGQMKNRYLPGGGTADVQSALLVEYICYLEVTLTSKPTWWKPLEFTEADLVMKVYQEAVSYTNRFLGRGPKRREADSDDGGEDGGGGDSDPEGDVEPSVSSPDQRSKTTLAHSSRA
jgi:hypothetical protein